MFVAQLVRASDCGSEGRGFESHLAPVVKKPVINRLFYLYFIYDIRMITVI